LKEEKFMSHHVATRVAFLPFVIAAVAAAWSGCNATTGGTGFGGSTTTAGTGGNNTGTGGAGTAGGTNTGTGGGSIIDLDAGDSDVIEILDDASTCVGTNAAAQQIPVDMIVLFDRSGSMDDGVKWPQAKAGLKTFIQDPASAGISVGLLYFPNDNADDCIPADYAQLEVPLGVLPGNAQPLVSYIDAKDIGGATPTWGALKGTLQYATAYQTTNPTHKVVVVLATDGDPTECTIEDIATIAALAKSAHNYNGVQTYALAMSGATVSALDQIAAAGGTTKSYDITTNVSGFSAAMASIRNKAAACEFIIPPPPAGQQLDTGKINVNYTPSGSTTKVTLPNVVSAAACGNSSAWYYDNNVSPKKVLLCPKACAKIQADPGAQVNVAFGCKTQQG
jgi:Mg-chelatase subunit ChlD